MSDYQDFNNHHDQQQEQEESTFTVPTRSNLRFAEEQHQREQQLLDDEENLPCCWWIRGIPAILFITFLIGITVGTTSAIIPDLQSDTFGNSTFLIVGGMGGGKGLMALAYTPLVGSLSDEKSRFAVLMTTMVLSLIPWALMTIFNNFWIYSISNMLFGLYNVSFTILVVIITTKVPQRQKSRTLALSANVAIFLAGIAGSSFLGPMFSGRTAFAISTVAQFCSLLAAFLFLRNTTNTPNKYFHLAEVGSSISNGSAIIKKDGHEDQDEDEEQNNDESSPRSATQENRLNNENTSLLIPSSQQQEESGKVTGKKKSYSIGFHLARAWKLFKSNNNVRILFLISFFNYLTSDMLDQMLFIYFDEVLNFSSNDVTYTIVIMSVASLFFVGFVAATRNQISDTWVLRLALTSSFIMVCLYAVVKNKLFVILLPAVNAIGMAALPAVSSLTVDSVNPAEIGVGQGCVQAARVAAGTICPFVYGYLFQMSYDSNFPGWPFFVAAGCIGISIFTTIFLKFE